MQVGGQRRQDGHRQEAVDAGTGVVTGGGGGGGEARESYESNQPMGSAMNLLL